MRCSIRNIVLPEPPRQATLPIHDNRFYGGGTETYEWREPVAPLNLTPPEPSNSMRAKAERKQKAILDLAREGKTLQEIAKETGSSKPYIKSIVMKYQEFGAKLADPKEWQDKECKSLSLIIRPVDEKIIELYNQGLKYREIAEKCGVTEAYISSRTSKLRRKQLIGRRVKNRDEGPI